jgi:hypothetical protein
VSARIRSRDQSRMQSYIRPLLKPRRLRAYVWPTCIIPPLKTTAVLLAAVALVSCGGKSTNIPAGPTSPSTPAEDANAILARCPTPAEVVASDRDLRLSFDYDVTAGRTVCTAAQSSRDLTLLQAQTYRVLTIMRRLTFDAPLPWTSSSLYAWMVSSIRGIRYRGDDIGNSFCCDPVDTIDIKATVGPNNSGLAALVFPMDFRAVGTLMVLFVHEARHNNGFPHSCADRVKDRTIAELGAWGIQYFLDDLLANHADPAFFPSSARAGFMQDAQQVCSIEFCEDHCR